jgi:hypothetical protein
MKEGMPPMTLEITPEQWRTVENGIPLPVKSPKQQDCVIVQKEVFDRLQKLVDLEDESDWIFMECEEDLPLS